jgi:transcriptional regulator with GAF, ATPase, and Fis domain
MDPAEFEPADIATDAALLAVERAIGALRTDLGAASGRDDRTVTLLDSVGATVAEALRGYRQILAERRRLAEENAQLRRTLLERGARLPAQANTPANGSPEASFRASMDAFEREALINALKRARGNRARAARLLSTTERIFNYRVRKQGIDWRMYKI